MKPLSASWSLLRGASAAIYESYRLGGKTMLAAPSILMLAVLPELAQHVFEIKIGMFESLEAARRLQHSTTRGYFGYSKIALVCAAIFLTARFWAMGASVRKALSLRWRNFGKAILGVGAMLSVGMLSDKSESILPHCAFIILSILSWCVQSILFMWAIGAWLDRDKMSLKEAFTSRMPNAATLLIVFVASFPLAQAAHLLIHKVVLGQSQIFVWALMILDAFIIVPLSAALTGSALFVGYDKAVTWRGWTKPPVGSNVCVSRIADRGDRHPDQNTAT